MSKKAVYICIHENYDSQSGRGGNLQDAFDNYVDKNHGEPDDFDDLCFYKAEEIEVERKIQLKSETKVTEAR